MTIGGLTAKAGRHRSVYIRCRACVFNCCFTTLAEGHVYASGDAGDGHLGVEGRAREGCPLTGKLAGSSMSSVAVLSRPERRRRWSGAEKARIVEESVQPALVVPTCFRDSGRRLNERLSRSSLAPRDEGRGLERLNRWRRNGLERTHNRESRAPPKISSGEAQAEVRSAERGARGL